MVTGRIGQSVLALPDLCQTRMVEDAIRLPCRFILQNIADSFGEPFGVENNEVPQAFVVGVIDNLA